MQTRILDTTPTSIQEAANQIRAGEIVAFPTETVYGLGANALDPGAVKKIFAAKGRPSDNPLIVHIASYDQLNDLVQEIPQDAEKLMQAFWPGPLTLIFPKSKKVPREITAGGKTVAIRWPSHSVAQALIQLAAVPVAAPSANLSGKPSPTKAEDVFEDLEGKVGIVLDGGATEIGVESTVLDITGEEPILLRAGGVSQEELEQVLEKKISEKRKAGEIARSPGMKYRHYAPKAAIILFSGDLPTPNSQTKNAVVTLDFIDASQFSFHHHFAGSTQRMAQEIFAVLRELDRQKMDRIYIQSIESTGLGQAIMDRLNRAAEG